jgi:hypothetical protein
MSNLAIKHMIETTRKHFQLPTTPRGRALHTVDWFLNGKPKLGNHDDTGITLQDVCGD